MRGKVRDRARASFEARRARVRRTIERSGRVRVTVYRSAKHIYAQLVDPVSGRTIAAVSTRTKGVANGLARTGNVEAAKRVGAALAALARERRIERVVFNRNGFLYHGRVKALAEAARQGGLQF
jgi:large subunit ribosomal protein L18